MRVYRFKKPELVLSLVEGGNLTANTTYYIQAIYSSLKGGYTSYYCASSPISDTASITTTNTEKAISVHYQTTGIISNFEDSGDGGTLIKSAMHCLDTGNVITIETGNYAGNHVVEWIDYDTLRINVPFGGTQQSTWKCEEETVGGAYCIKLWMGTTIPDIDGFFVGDRTFSHRAGPGYGYRINNILVDTEFSNQSAINSSLYWNKYGKSFKHLFEYGMPAIVGDDAECLLEDFQQVFEASGLFPFCRASDNDMQWFGFISLDFNATIYKSCVFSSVFGSIDMREATLEECTVAIHQGAARTYTRYKAKNTLTGTGLITIDEVPIYGGGLNPTSQLSNYYLGILGETHSWSRFFKVGIRASQFAYPDDGYLSDSTFYALKYIQLVYANLIPQVDRLFRNINLFDFSDYEIRMHTAYLSYAHNQNFENVNTHRFRNEKFLYKSHSNNCVDVVFYRKGKLYTDVEGVTCRITSERESLVYVSNSEGVVEFDVIEQYSKSPAEGTTGFYENTIYSFDIFLEKEGHLSYSLSVDIGKELDGLITSEMAPNPAPINYLVKRPLLRVFKSGKLINGCESIREGDMDFEIDHIPIENGQAEVTTLAKATYDPANNSILIEQELEGEFVEAYVIEEGNEVERVSQLVADDPKPVYINQIIQAEVEEDERIEAQVKEIEVIKAEVTCNS